jgi:hypothetical protein
MGRSGVMSEIYVYQYIDTYVQLVVCDPFYL